MVHLVYIVIIKTEKRAIHSIIPFVSKYFTPGPIENKTCVKIENITSVTVNNFTPIRK